MDVRFFFLLFLFLLFFKMTTTPEHTVTQSVLALIFMNVCWVWALARHSYTLSGLFYLHLASNTRSFTGPRFNHSIKRVQLQKKKSPGEQNTPVRVRIHENNYEYVWKSLPAIFPAFLAVLIASGSGENQHSVCEERRKKSVRRRWRSLKFRINIPVTNSDTAALLAN